MKGFYSILSFCVLIAGIQGSLSLDEYLLNPTRYDRNVRPAVNAGDAINVTFGVSLKEIVDLSDTNHLLVTRLEIRESWIDRSLSWNKSAFGGQEEIALHPESIWIPDIVLYNNAGEDFGDGQTRTHAIIHHDGLVSVNIPCIVKNSCKIRVANYPFDEQSCYLKFGSWNYDGSQIALRMEAPTADLSEYSENVEWELKSVKAEFHSLIYNCCPNNPYEDITYTIVTKRRSLFYAMYLIIPAVIISVLTILVFLLPPSYSERMTVGMAILVGLSFFFLLVAENMPATSEAIPLIGMYYTMTMLEVSCAFFMACWVLRFHYSNPTEGDVPKWIKVYLLGYAARFLRFNFAEKKPTEEAKEAKEDMVSSDTRSCSLASVDANDDQDTEKPQGSPQIATEPSTPQASRHNDANTILLENIRHEEILEARQEEWKHAAIVLNSIFMYIYILAMIVTVLAIFVGPVIG